MRCNFFYGGLNPEYRQMLAHAVDGEYPSSYSDLLLATWKLERWAEAREPLLPKKLQLMDQLQCILRFQVINFPHASWRATALSTIKVSIGNVMAEEDPHEEPEGEEETKPSSDEEELLWVWEPWPFHMRLPKNVSRPTWKVYWNMKEGTVKKGG